MNAATDARTRAHSASSFASKTTHCKPRSMLSSMNTRTTGIRASPAADRDPPAAVRPRAPVGALLNPNTPLEILLTSAVSLECVRVACQRRARVVVAQSPAHRHSRGPCRRAISHAACDHARETPRASSATGSRILRNSLTERGRRAICGGAGAAGLGVASIRLR